MALLGEKDVIRRMNQLGWTVQQKALDEWVAERDEDIVTGKTLAELTSRIVKVKRREEPTADPVDGHLRRDPFVEAIRGDRWAALKNVKVG